MLRCIRYGLSFKKSICWNKFTAEANASSLLSFFFSYLTSRGLKQQEKTFGVTTGGKFSRLALRARPRVSRSVLAPVVRKVDNAIHRINRYAVDKCLQNKPRYRLDIPLTNRVRYPYCKFSARIYGPSENCAAHKSERKKWGSVTYSTDRENEVSKIFIIYYIDTDEIPEFFHLLKNHIFTARSEDTIFIFQVWGYCNKWLFWLFRKWIKKLCFMWKFHQNITWPPGDTDFIFSCWKYLSFVSILSPLQDKISIPARPRNILYISGYSPWCVI